MTPEFNEFLRKITTAKGITVLIIVLALAIFVWKNFDFLTEISLTFKKEGQQSEPIQKDDNSSGVPSLSFGEIIIPPNSENLPSIVVFEIKNTGSAITNNIRVSADMGTAKIIAYEIIGPDKADVKSTDSGSSILNVDIEKIRPHENVYIYMHTNLPAFKKISISSDSTVGVRDYTFTDHLRRDEKVSPKTFSTLLLFVLGAFILVMSVYFTVVLIIKLNKLLKID